jgi:hypothetical protein
MYCIISVVYDYITILNTILTSYNTQLVDPTLQLFVIPLKFHPNIKKSRAREQLFTPITFAKKKKIFYSCENKYNCSGLCLGYIMMFLC